MSTEIPTSAGTLARKTGTTGEHHTSGMRKGTVLILVLGVLALLAVITAVYAAVGSADRRTGDAVRRSRQVEDVSDQIANYIGGIIARDATALEYVTTFGSGASASIVTRRENTDYPFTEWTRWGAGSGTGVRFNPEGTYVLGSTTVGRTASDPWLAATEPEYLSFDPTQDDLSTPTTPDDYFLNFRDWKHISNISPDGRYVNLFNLRPQGVGFDAPSRNLSGVAAPGDIGTANMVPPTLLQWTSGNAANVPTPTNNFQVGPTTIVNTATTAPNSAVNRPAYFSNRQRFAFRPMDIDAGQTGAGKLTWADPEYIRYQWVDADGDGFADARLQELVDENVVNSPRRIISSSTTDIRWFVGARIVDLSSMVNVNVATDGLTPPSAAIPAGATPAEVDLRRLLMMTDFAGLTLDAASNRSLYAGLRQPQGAQDRENDYRNYRNGAGGTLPWASLIGAYGYGGLGRAFLDASAPDPNFNAAADPQYPWDPIAEPGNWINGRFQRGATALAAGSPVNIWNGQLDRMYAYQGKGGDLPARPFDESDLAELLTFRMSNDSDVTSLLEQAVDARGVALNATSATARTWAVLPGFAAMPTWLDGSPRVSRYSPLRSSRATAIERNDRVSDPDFASANKIAGTDPTALMQSAVDPRQRLTTLSGHRPLRSTLLDPALTASARLSADELQVDVGTLLAGLREPDSSSTTQVESYLKRKNRVVSELYRGYARALMNADDVLGPNADWAAAASAAWPNFGSGGTTANLLFGRHRTLFYGYNGPELPMNLAAHMAVNFVDAHDTDDEPSVYTMIIDRTARTDLDTEGNTSIASRNQKWVAWGSAGDAYARRLDLGEIAPPGTTDPFAPAVLPTTSTGTVDLARANRKLANGQVGSQAYSSVKNIYGLEVFPVITNVAMLTVFVDMPTGPKGVKTDLTGDNDTELAPTIRGKLSYQEDLAARVIAFQLHNPFERTVYLTADGKKDVAATESEAAYYIEYGGRTYKVCDQVLAADGSYSGGDGSTHNAVALEPGQTRWFYYVNRRIGELENRWEAAAKAVEPPIPAGSYDSLFRDFIQAQLGLATSGGDPAVLIEFDAEAGTLDLIPANGSIAVNGSDDLVSTSSPDQNGVVRLWRRYLDEGETAVLNETENDILIDRLRISEPVSFAESVSENPPSHEIENAGNNDYKRGMTIFLARSVRRPDENQVGVDRGGLPAYMMEVRSAAVGTSLNKSEKNTTGGLSNFSASDFRSESGWNDSLFGFLTENSNVSGTFGTSVMQSLTEEPGTTRSTPSPVGDNRSTPADRFGSGGGTGARDIRPVITLDSNLRTQQFTKPNGSDQELPEVVRTTDLLMPLAIGAEYDPDRAAGPATPDDPRWLTVGESLAIASNYDPRPISDPEVSGVATVTRALTGAQGGGPFAAITTLQMVPNPYYKLGHRNATDLEANYRYPRLDSGRLVLNDFTPFYNFTDNQSAADPLFEPNATNPANGDQVRGLGVPAALGILSEFRTMKRNIAIEYDQPTDTYLYVDDSTNPDHRLGHSPQGSLVKPIFGTININTAPLAVLRLLPMLSPTQATYPAGPLAGQFEWWGEYPTNLNVTDRSTDIAARLVAYRDRLTDFPARVDPLAGAGAPRRTINYADDSPTARIDQPSSLDGRRFHLNQFISISGNELRPGVIREQPGFASVGELLMLTDRREPGTAGYTPDKTAIDILAKDGQNINTAELANGKLVADGIIHRRVDSTGGTANVFYEADQATDDYAERLAVAGALMNTVSVRSDYFACWFVLQGYRRAEVQRLGPDDPLIPAIQRRFLVIYDRSNVVTPEDRPRVVLFKEVPM